MKRKSVLYLDVAEQIKTGILSGKYPVGTLLPTEKELEAYFNVSKITIRKAIELLAAEELVEKKSGKGTTVLSNYPYNRIAKTGRFTEYLNQTGQKVTKQVIELKNVQLEPTSAVGALMGPQVVKLSRLYLIDDQPYIYFTYYLPSVMADVSKGQFEEDALYRLMDQHQIDIYKFQDSFQSVPLTKTEQEILATKALYGLKRIRKSIGYANKIVEYSEAIYDTERQPYVIEYEA